MMKYNNQKQLGRKRFIWLINSESQSVEGKHGRNSNRQELEGADSDAMKNSSYSLATYSQPRDGTTQNGLEHPPAPSPSHTFSIEASSSQMFLDCVKLT